MDTNTFSLFAALLAVIAAAGAGALVVARLLSHRSEAAASVLAAVDPIRYQLATLVAAASMGGSLYFSEVAGFVPCELCWYQRISMYPLVVVLGVASVRPDASARLSATILASIGAAVSAYHVQLQRFPDQGSTCDLEAPCTAIWVEELGFVTIPTMALAGFLAILALVWLPRSHEVAEPTDDERVHAGV